MEGCCMYYAWNYANIFTYIYILKWYIIVILKFNYFYPIINKGCRTHLYFLIRWQQNSLRNNLLKQSGREYTILLYPAITLDKILLILWERRNRNSILNSHKANSMMWSCLINEGENCIVNTKIVVIQYYQALLYLFDVFLKIISKVN